MTLSATRSISTAPLGCSAPCPVAGNAMGESSRARTPNMQESHLMTRMIFQLSPRQVAWIIGENSNYTQNFRQRSISVMRMLQQLGPLLRTGLTLGCVIHFVLLVRV